MQEEEEETIATDLQPVHIRVVPHVQSNSVDGMYCFGVGVGVFRIERTVVLFVLLVDSHRWVVLEGMTTAWTMMTPPHWVESDTTRYVCCEHSWVW